MTGCASTRRRRRELAALRVDVSDARERNQLPARNRHSKNARRLDTFERRHMGPSEKDQLEMLKTIGFESLDELVTSTVPANIRLEEPMELGPYPGVL